MKALTQLFIPKSFAGLLLLLSYQTVLAAPYFEGTGYINQQTRSHILFNNYKFPLSPVVKVYNLKKEKIRVRDIGNKDYVKINVIKVAGKIYVDIIQRLPPPPPFIIEEEITKK